MVYLPRPTTGSKSRIGVKSKQGSYTHSTLGYMFIAMQQTLERILSRKTKKLIKMCKKTQQSSATPGCPAPKGAVRPDRALPKPFRPHILRQDIRRALSGGCSPPLPAACPPPPSPPALAFPVSGRRRFVPAPPPSVPQRLRRASWRRPSQCQRLRGSARRPACLPPGNGTATGTGPRPPPRSARQRQRRRRWRRRRSAGPEACPGPP